MTMGVWKKTAVSFWHDDFIVFQKLKHTFTSFEIQYVWHTAAKENVFYFVLFYCIFKKKRTLWGIKTAGQAAKSTCEASQIQQLKWTNSHILFVLTNDTSGGKMLNSWRSKILFLGFFLPQILESENFYSVDFLFLTLYLAVSLRRALRKKINMIKTNRQTKVLHVKFAVTTPTCNTDQHSGRAAKESGE